MNNVSGDTLHTTSVFTESGNISAVNTSMPPEKTAPGVFISTSTDQTIALGNKLGKLLQPGDILVLTGDLGAGKTQLTKGIAGGMGISEDITSPTFTIEMVYEGANMPLYHFDLYRLSDLNQLEDTGLYDALESDGPTVIEWGEQFVEQIGPRTFDVYVSRLADELATNLLDETTINSSIGSLDDSSLSEVIEPRREIRFVPMNARGQEIIAEL